MPVVQGLVLLVPQSWCSSQVLGAHSSLPPGPGADVLKSRCVICHEADIITSQKLSLTGWTNSVNKMVRWGSQITPQEREILLPYLAAHFAPLRQGYGGQAPTPAASHPNTDAGRPSTSARVWSAMTATSSSSRS